MFSLDFFCLVVLLCGKFYIVCLICYCEVSCGLLSWGLSGTWGFWGLKKVLVILDVILIIGLF